MWKHFYTVVFIFLIFRSNFAEKIVEINDQSFVKHRDTAINLFKENVFESKAFEFEALAFKIPMPDFVTNLNNPHIIDEAKKYAYPLLEQTNDAVLDSFETICSNDFDSHREKREVVTLTIIAITGVIALFGVVMNIVNNSKIERLREELIKSQEHLERVTAELNAVRQQLANDRYLTELKEEFSAYVYRAQKIMLEFIKLLNSGKVIKFSDIPDSIKKYLNTQKISEDSEKFYFLKLKSCMARSIIVEITSAEAKMTGQIKCNKYTNMGYFSNDFAFYHQFVLPNLYCYKSDKECSQIDTRNCIQHFNVWNCTNTALKKCYCQPYETEQCKVKTEHANSNFLQYEEYQDFTTFATTHKVYTVIYPTKTVSKNVPSSGIFATVINEQDSIKIGDFTIRGKSFKPTFIDRIFDEKFVARKLETVENITYNYTPLESHANEIFKTVPWQILVALPIIFLLLMIAFCGFLYKKCCSNKGDYGRVNVVFNGKEPSV